MSQKYQTDDQTFIKAVQSSKSIYQAITSLGLNARGAAYKVFKKRCQDLQLDYSHLKSDKERRKEITDEQVRIACGNNISCYATLRELQLNENTNTNNSWLDNNIKILNINTNHWLGQGHLKGKTHDWSPKIDLEDILVENSKYQTNVHLKRRLLKEGLLNYCCYNPECGISEWHGKKLSLQLEHINGNNSDNRIDNLILLCPNCHSLTSTFCRRKTSLV